jgi:hypothetical protein
MARACSIRRGIDSIVKGKNEEVKLIIDNGIEYRYIL